MTKDTKLTLDKLKNSGNIADLLDEYKLSEIGEQVYNGYKIDEDSRSEWKETVDKAMDIAKQKVDPKNHPWPGASNVKFPLISEASIQFAARVMPEIIQNDKVIRANIVGQDLDGAKLRRAHRVSEYMSYQLLCESTDWEDGTDKLLQVIPVLGTAFKKTYYDAAEKKNVSMLCVPDKIVVNYATQSLETARRITHVITMYSNDIIERQRRGIFSESVDPELLRPIDSSDNDKDFAIELLEQHCYLDLDDDDYKEPYIVTIHKNSRQVLRITHRFNTIEKNKNGEVVCIEPIHYFTDFHFIRSPDGGFYSIGFGSLLLPINSAINTLINQLLDAGTLSNTQGGFLGRGLRIKNGELKIKMGEWKVLDAASGTNISQNVFPLPVREPSQTLFSLLGLLLQMGKDLSSSTDVMKGQQPAQNVATGTISALVEQGSKIFAAINKRLYRSLKKEYTKLYALNAHHLSDAKYKEIMDDPEADAKKDFELYSMDVYPVSDPSLSSDQQRLNRSMVMHQLPTVDMRAADEYTLQSMSLDQSTIDRLLPKPDPSAPPPPDQQLILAQIQLINAQIVEMGHKMTVLAQNASIGQQDMALKAAMTDSQIQESAARTVKMQIDASHGDSKVAIAAAKLNSSDLMKGAQFNHKQELDQAKLVLNSMDAKTKATKVSTDLTKTLIKDKTENKKIELDAKEKGIPKYSEHDILHTAKLKGLSPEQVRNILKEKDKS